jgi:hypothetical protein
MLHCVVLLTGKAAGGAVGKRSDGIARVRSGQCLSCNRMRSRRPRQRGRLAAKFRGAQVLRKVAVIDILAGEWQLLLAVASGDDPRRHGRRLPTGTRANRQMEKERLIECRSDHHWTLSSFRHFQLSSGRGRWARNGWDSAGVDPWSSRQARDGGRIG